MVFQSITVFCRLPFSHNLSVALAKHMMCSSWQLFYQIRELYFHKLAMVDLTSRMHFLTLVIPTRCTMELRTIKYSIWCTAGPIHSLRMVFLHSLKQTYFCRLRNPDCKMESGSDLGRMHWCPITLVQNFRLRHWLDPDYTNVVANFRQTLKCWRLDPCGFDFQNLNL